jgi:uncharacterized protein (TIGR00299 family) protein
MRIGYLECFSGISGDMFLGALVDAGVSADLLREVAESLGVEAKLEVTRVTRSGISATKVDVYIASKRDQPREEYWAEHEHDHSHTHAHSSGEAQPSAAVLDGGHGRGLSQIRETISRTKISAAAKQKSIAVFEALVQAEAKIHNTEPEKVHLHEVGAADALVDVTCAMAGAEMLGVDGWICSPLNVGGGNVTCAHGTFPVPAPATLELLKDAPLYSSGINKELVTPTGAAIVHTLVTRFAEFPRMKVAAVGYGAGSRDLPGYPNVLRLTIGDSLEETTSAASERIVVLEANLDDLNPQVFGYVMERALAEGALDVFAVPVQMKKNRPGMLLTVLSPPEQEERLTKLIFSETTTLGVRRREEYRQRLARRHVTVGTRWGDVRLKVANLNGTVSNYSPEFEDCRRIAVEHSLPLKQVMQEAIRLYLEQHG